MGFKVLQVSNITPQATREQIHQLFTYLGRIRTIKVYPTENNVLPSTPQKFAYIEFEDEKSVELGQHLTNMVLIDRAVVCIPSMDDVIPSEDACLAAGGPSMPGQRSLPAHVTNKVHDVGDGTQVILTLDPNLEQLGLPSYPPLPANTDPSKIEEIRRTIYVGNIPKGTEGQAIVDFFNNNIGEVMYVRMADGPAGLTCAYCYVEFSSQATVPVALQNSGMVALGGSMLKMQHSRVAIIKPQQKTDAQALEEIESAIQSGSRVDRERTRSPVRRRSRSPRRSPARRSRSPRRSPSRRRDRSRERERGGDRDRDRKRSRSRERKRSKSRDRKRSRSRDRRERDRSRDRRDRERGDRDRDRKRSRSKDRKSERKRSRSRDRGERDKKRDRSRERRDKEKDRKKEKERERSKKDEKEKEEEEKLRERLLEKVAARSDSRDDVKQEDEDMDIELKKEVKEEIEDSQTGSGDEGRSRDVPMKEEPIESD